MTVGDSSAALQQPAGMNPAAKKLQKILDSRFETDKEAISAMQSLSEIMPENTILARRNLRSDLERRNLHTSQQFLAQFKQVRDQLHALADIVTDINTSVSMMQDDLQRTKESTSALMQRTNELNDEANSLAMQQNLTEAFCRKFYLLPHEESLIKSKEQIQSDQVPQLLEVLSKIKIIHNDAKVLLRSKNQTTGLEIVEKMGALEEMAFEKLYRWTQRECRNMSSECPDISSLVVSALAVLSERKTLLNYTMDEFSMIRKGVVSRGFIDALTRGSSGGDGEPRVKPIEMHAHDPVRYIGDMLACIHQALASEREHVQILLQKADVSAEDISFFVAFSSEGLCRPLKVRLDHVIANDPDAITMFKIRGLLKFYYATFSESISPTSPLCSAMLENAGLFDKLFFSTLRTSLNVLCEQQESPPSDLTPSPSVGKILAILQQILQSHSSTFFDAQAKQNDFKVIVDLLIASLMQCLQQTAASLSAADMSVYLMNSLHKAKSTLAVYEFTDAKIEMISGQIDAHLDTLINEQVVHFLIKVDLMFLHNKQANNDPSFSNDDLARIKKASHSLDTLLSHPDQFTLPQMRAILSSTLREAALTRSYTYFSRLYTDMIEFLKSAGNAEFVQTVRAPEQVSSLLSY